MVVVLERKDARVLLLQFSPTHRLRELVDQSRADPGRLLQAVAAVRLGVSVAQAAVARLLGWLAAPPVLPVLPRILRLRRPGIKARMGTHLGGQSQG